MTDSPYLPPVRLEEHRERVVTALSNHFAHDHLDTAEFERRLDLAYRATSLAELQKLEADLPALPVAAPGPTLPVAAADESEVRSRQVVFALMGGTERKGVWTPARNLDVVAIMGGVELDFRQARFAPGVTQLNALAIMGGIEILVPPGLRVESSGVGIMGAFQSVDQRGDPADPHAPVLRISGLALMGGVEIRQRFPGESASDARRRLREERKQLKQQQRRLQRGD